MSLIDLAVAVAIASSTRISQLTRKSVSFGELGLTGEVRRVNPDRTTDQ